VVVQSPIGGSAFGYDRNDTGNAAPVRPLGPANFKNTVSPVLPTGVTPYDTSGSCWRITSPACSVKA